jgi:hypothetical protein
VTGVFRLGCTSSRRVSNNISETDKTLCGRDTGDRAAVAFPFAIPPASSETPVAGEVASLVLPLAAEASLAFTQSLVGAVINVSGLC